MKRRSKLLALLAVGGSALAVRLAYLVEARSQPWFDAPVVDAGFYDLVARHLAAGGSPPLRLFWQPLFYPLTLAGVYAGTAGSILGAKLLQCFLGAGTAVLAALLAWRLLGPAAGVVAGAIVALYGPLVLFEGELLASGWAAFWGVALILVVLRAAEHRRADDAVLYGLMSGAAVLTRPTFLPGVVALAAWLAIAGRRRDGRAALLVLAAGLAFAATTLPVALWSAHETGRLSFLPGAGGLDLYLGNNPQACDTLRVRPGADWGRILALPAAHGVRGYAAGDRWFRGEVLHFAREHPESFLAGFGRKALELFGSREIPRNIDPYVLAGHSRVLRALLWKAGSFGFPFGLLLPLALVGIGLEHRRLSPPFLWLTGLYAAAVTAVFVTARYRVPLVPLLAVAAAAGAVSIVREWRRRGWPLRLAIVLALAVLVALGTLPGPFCVERLGDTEAELYAAVGSSLVERGRDEEALTSFRRAVRLDPGLRDARYESALLLAERGDPGAAEEEYRAALRIDPDFAPAHNNLGSLLLARGRTEAAIAEFEAAVARDPDGSEARVNLGRALLVAGRPEEALVPLRRAVAAEPGSAEGHFVLGAAELAAGRPEEAVAELETAIGERPTARAENELGTALMALGRSAEAAERFVGATRLDPAFLPAYSNAGAAYAAVGRYSEAERWLRTALEHGTEDPGARVNLAWVLDRTGRSAAAVRELEAVLADHPDDPMARRRLQAIRRREGLR